MLIPGSCPVVQPRIFGLHDSHTPQARHVQYVACYICCSEPEYTHVLLNPFYHFSTLDVIHVRKDGRPFCSYQRSKVALFSMYVETQL